MHGTTGVAFFGLLASLSPVPVISPFCRNHLRISVPMVSRREGEDLFHVPRLFRLQAAPLAAVLIVGSIGASMSGHYLISNGV